MKTSPHILNTLDDAGQPLPRIQIKPNDSRNEAWLQKVLFASPELLPIDEFDDLYSPAIPIGREVGMKRGRIDILYASPNGRITIVETKLWKNPEKHRTVVAQVIDYARQLATWDYDQLCSAVLASSTARGEDQNASLEKKVEAELSRADLELHMFQENVNRCLEQGNFLLLIVGDYISPNIVFLTEAIQSAPGLNFTIGLAEMQLHEMNAGSDWPLIVIPKIVGRTVEKTRGVVQVRYDGDKPKIEVHAEDEGEVSGASPAKELDLPIFLSEIRKDLVEPFEEGIEEWEKTGGAIHFTDKMMFFEMDINGHRRRAVRCRKYQISLIRRTAIEEWGLDPSHHDSYLDSLQAVPIAYETCLNEKMWIKYDNISGDGLRVLLRTAREAVQRIKSEN